MASSCDLNWEDTKLTTYPGSPHPLGATYDGHGINFALYSEYATKVYLCLFRPNHDGTPLLVEYARINIKGKYDTQQISLKYSLLFRTNPSDLAHLLT